MPKYVIEREIPGAGKMSPEQLQGISEKSCGVLRNLGPQIQWLTSYVTDDKIYCVYIAPNAEMVREHAKQGGFPANKVSQVRSIIDPTTATRAAAHGLDPAGSLRNNDSYHFFSALGDLMHTGPTGTNVGDVQVALLA